MFTQRKVLLVDDDVVRDAARATCCGSEAVFKANLFTEETAGDIPTLAGS